MTPKLRRDIERWFISRGVPQLIDGYTTERRMDARALPIVAGWLVVGTILFWGTREDWPPVLNALAVIATLAVVGLGIWLLQRRWGRWVLGREIPVAYVFAVGALVAAPSALVHADWLEGVSSGLGALLGIGVIYVVVGLGLAEIAWWGLRRLESELLTIVNLLSTTLPVLLILVFFLLFAAELWEAAHLLAVLELWLVLALVAALAVLLVVSAIRTEMRTLQTLDAAAVRSLAAATPAAPLLPHRPDADLPPLTALQGFNLQVLAVIAQLIQSLFVALLVMGFLVVFGILALPVELQERWVGEPVAVLLEFDLAGETRALSLELVTVTALLGAIVGLYFTGLAVTDSAYRTAHFGRIVDEVRMLVAARAVYARALAAPAA